MLVNDWLGRHTRPETKTLDSVLCVSESVLGQRQQRFGFHSRSTYFWVLRMILCASGDIVFG